MIVLDTSIIIDSLMPHLGNRHNRALQLLNLLSEKSILVYEPKILLIELACVLSRYRGVGEVRNIVNSLSSQFNLLTEDTLFEEAFKIALNTHCRAVDAYFISAAAITDSTLVSNDKVMVLNAKSCNVAAYYFIEDFDGVFRVLEKI